MYHDTSGSAAAAKAHRPDVLLGAHLVALVLDPRVDIHQHLALPHVCAGKRRVPGGSTREEHQTPVSGRVRFGVERKSGLARLAWKHRERGARDCEGGFRLHSQPPPPRAHRAPPPSPP